MGSESSSAYTQEDYDSYSLVLYRASAAMSCLPDVGIDDSLLKYSGTDSNVVLQTYATEMLSQVPGYVEKLGSVLGPLTSVPNAVGLGAFVIAMMIEMCVKTNHCGPTTTATSDDTYGIIKRVFGEEKASRVRDTMSLYLMRHQMFINNDQQLMMEISSREVQLNEHLTSLRNSLLHDGQMSTRGFKIWVNGASFHIQMLIHQARLNVRARKRASDYVTSISAAINAYVSDLDSLLKEYKAYKIRTTEISFHLNCFFDACLPSTCAVLNTETNCRFSLETNAREPCGPQQLVDTYVTTLYSKVEALANLKNHFSNFRNNLNYQIIQRGSFTLPSAR